MPILKPIKDPNPFLYECSSPNIKFNIWCIFDYYYINLSILLLLLSEKQLIIIKYLNLNIKNRVWLA